MLGTKQQLIRYYLFAFANFIAAVGGGTILGKGVGIIDAPFLKSGSVLALFAGCLLGLIYLQIASKKWSATIARWFSFFGAFSSIILLYIYQTYAINGKLMAMAAVSFFVLLSLRFGFWFYSRVLRASAAAGQQQQIAWVEMGYYVGMIFGLIIWTFFGINLDLVTALIIDALLQCVAGTLDIFSNRIQVNVTTELSENKASDVTMSLQANNAWIWRLVMAVVFLTIAIQTIIFYSAHQVAIWFTPYILAFFYFGVSIAAYCYKKFNFQLEWITRKNHLSGFAMISSDNKKYTKKISFLFAGMLTAICTSIAVFGIIIWGWGALPPIESNTFLQMISLREVVLLLFVIVAAFLYEILALAILDRIGLEEKSIKRQGMLIRAYGLMGVGGAVCLWVLGVSESAMMGLLFTLGLCLLFAFSFVWKRSEITTASSKN